jgi:hypothetical protein
LADGEFSPQRREGAEKDGGLEETIFQIHPNRVDFS